MEVFVCVCCAAVYENEMKRAPCILKMHKKQHPIRMPTHCPFCGAAIQWERQVGKSRTFWDRERAMAEGGQ